jgi:hypothetical protein
VNTFQIHIIEARLRWRRWGLFDDDRDRFSSLNCVAVYLWRVDGYRQPYRFLVLFDNLHSAIRCNLHLHNVHMGSDSLDLGLNRLLGGWLGLLSVPIEVVFIL